MDILDQSTIFRFHNELITKYGVGNIAALGWNDAESQAARFRILSQIADLNGFSVLDAGCGHADLYACLLQQNPQVHYYGVEQIPALLKEALKKYGNKPNTYFFEGDFSAGLLPQVDYTIACGSLNYRNSDDNYIFKMIEKLFYNSRIGFGFNLPGKIDLPHPLLESYDPLTITEFCNTLTSDVRLIQGYHKEDYTVFMYH